jgi:hypothetical protein
MNEQDALHALHPQDQAVLHDVVDAIGPGELDSFPNENVPALCVLGALRVELHKCQG